MFTMNRTSTTEMEVTSIRLERELKERLKELAGSQGYQALIRDVLWNYIQQQSDDYQPRVAKTDIRVSIPATARCDEQCALTGKTIRAQEAILLGLTIDGQMVPIKLNSFPSSTKN